jgi:hypothetical protein
LLNHEQAEAMEAIMAYVAHPSNFHGAVPVKAAPAAAPLPASRRGFWSRLLDAILDSRQRDAEQEVARYMARRGKLTDSVEREIAGRFTSGNWGPRL